MPNLAVPAAAEGMPSRPLEDLLSDYLAEKREASTLYARWNALRDQLPEWAAPEHRYLQHDGRFSGEIVGWPMSEDMTPPDFPGSYRVVRSSLRETFSHFMITAPRADDDRPSAKKWRRAARLNGFKAVRRRIKRIREQRAEEARLGLPSVEAAMDAASDRVIALEDDMRAHAVGSAPDALAILLVLELVDSAQTNMPIDDQSGPSVCAEVLSRLAPLLTGVLAIVVSDIVHHRDRLYPHLLIGGGGAYTGSDGHPIDALARAYVEAA